MLHRAYALLLPISLIAFAVLAQAPALAQDESAPDKPDAFAEATEGLALSEGFLDIYSSTEKGKVLALLPAADADRQDPNVLLRFIHAQRLKAGLGSNPLGLDRGWGNAGRILRFRRIGDRIVAEVENHRYRAVTDNALERAAVEDSFASSFVWSTEILAENDEGRALIDLAGLLTDDALGLAQKLGRDGGKFSRAADRSLPDAGSVLVFPDNVEVDAWITFTGDEPGSEIRATAADANAVTLVQHHSFVRLPDDGYRVRLADPRTGTFTLGFYDYASDLAEPVIGAYAMRHRLQYKEPGRPESGVREPLVFHIDPGAPARIQEALLDGASWWKDAFAAAGFADGFRVELLPEDAHPLDIRYNVVQWVHRQTRGWSYGGGIVDPRTGEMIKGHVILGSQRVRQDRMIFEGLAGVEAVGTGKQNDPVELALDRIRQLAAHELGHALGFRPQLRRLDQRSCLGDGLPGALGQGRRCRRAGFFEGLRSRHRRMGQAHGEMAVFGVCARYRRHGTFERNRRRRHRAGPAFRGRSARPQHLDRPSRRCGLGQRRRRDCRAGKRAGGARTRPGRFRCRPDRRRPTAVGSSAGPRADLSLPPLSGRRGGKVAGRRALQLRAARWPGRHALTGCRRKLSARRWRRCWIPWIRRHWICATR